MPDRLPPTTGEDPGTAQAEALAAAGILGTFSLDAAGVTLRWVVPGHGDPGRLTLDAFLGLLRPEDPAAAPGVIEAALAGGRVALPCRPALPGLATGRAVLQGSGRSGRLIGTLVEAPPDLAAEEGWPDAIYQHASVGIAELDPATRRLVRVNEAYCRLTGFSRAQLLGELKLYDLTHPDDVGAERRLRDQLMAGEIGSFWVEKRFRRGDGSYAWAEVSVSLARRGAVLREVRVVQDITERKHAAAALRESEARFRALFDAMPIGLVAIDLGTLRFVSANAQAAAQLGYSAEEFASVTLAEVDVVQTRGELLARAQEVAAAPPGTLFQLERQQRCRDGSLRETLISNVRVDAGGCRLVYGAWLDVTEQRAATAALRESEARLRATYECAAVGIAELHPVTRQYLHVNETYARVGGRSVAEWTGGLSLSDVTLPEDLAAEEPDRRRLLRGEIGSYRLEKRFVRADGGIGWAEVSVSLVRDSAGHPRREIRVTQDITARHLAEAALRESEERLRLALAAGEVGTFDYDLRTGEVNWDERTRAMWGVTPDARVTEEAFWAGVHPDDRDRVREVFAATRAGGHPGPHEVEHRVVSLADGTERQVASRWRLAMANGRPARVVGTRVDVTAQRRAAEVLARSHAELERLVEERTAELRRSISERRELQERIRRTERLDALGQLTGGVAHDFNNLLTAVLGGAEEILDAVPTGHPLREPAETILAGAERGAELTRRLLAFAREQPLKPRDLDVGAALAGMRGLLRRVAGDGVELRLKLPAPGAPPLVARTDPVQLETAVLNLVANARDAMPQGGPLTISAAPRRVGEDAGGLTVGAYVVVSVSDHGTGMPPEVLARAMEPFFTTKEVGRGTGLGLSIVYGFAQQSGGTAEIESAPGEGTTVRLLLPAAQAASEVASTEPPTVQPGQGEGILVVEDDPLLRAQLGMQLTTLGYRPELTVDAASALARLRAGVRLDLLLTDAVLPGGMSGMQLAREAAALRPGIALLLVGGDGGAAAEPGGVARRVLRKPYRRSELAAALRAALDQGESARQGRLASDILPHRT